MEAQLAKLSNQAVQKSDKTNLVGGGNNQVICWRKLSNAMNSVNLVISSDMDCGMLSYIGVGQIQR